MAYFLVMALSKPSLNQLIYFTELIKKENQIIMNILKLFSYYFQIYKNLLNKLN